MSGLSITNSSMLSNNWAERTALFREFSFGSRTNGAWLFRKTGIHQFVRYLTFSNIRFGIGEM